WCALWFWPFDQLEHIPTPTNWLTPTPEARQIVENLQRQLRFFHWELEFPDVFNKQRASQNTFTGFDAIIGNPPWETSKPNSKEYFSNIDPLYRSYGKQTALDYQKSYFEQDI